ncbi:MAG: FKBP-type peptidyl-prolyl cis-trans isomerase [Candidatus Kapaibacterium sp.]
MKLKKALIILIALAVAIPAFAQSKIEIKTWNDSLAYAVGVQLGMSLKQDSLIVNPEIIHAAVDDVFNAPQTRLNNQEIMGVLTRAQKQIQERQQRMAGVKADENLAEANKFLEENKSKPGVKVTESGLQYQVIKEGTGKSPAETDMVKVHYHGTLPDGTVFDSSVERGEPAEFPLNRVIPGWTEGVQLMKEGAKYKFFVPPSLGYGERGAGQKIGPNQLLIFEVELLEVMDQQNPQGGQGAPAGGNRKLGGQK